jgi:hypothetical protein
VEFDLLKKLEAKFEDQIKGKDLLDFHFFFDLTFFLCGGGWTCVTCTKFKMMN